MSRSQTPRPRPPRAGLPNAGGNARGSGKRQLPAWILVVVVAIGVGIWVFMQDAEPLTATDTAAPNASTSAGLDEIHELLNSLTVAKRDPSAGYSREEFGERWADIDGNGCDQRNDVLRRDLIDIELDWDGCRVVSGVLHDPFSGETIDFVRGPVSSEEVQIDHLVPLNDAWQKGAQHWTAAKREQFANDPINLLAVSGDMNFDKGSSDASFWMPPNTNFHCEYVSLQIVTKAHYNLWITTYERDAFEKALRTC